MAECKWKNTLAVLIIEFVQLHNDAVLRLIQQIKIMCKSSRYCFTLSKIFTWSSVACSRRITFHQDLK